MAEREGEGLTESEEASDFLFAARGWFGRAAAADSTRLAFEVWPTVGGMPGAQVGHAVTAVAGKVGGHRISSCPRCLAWSSCCSRQPPPRFVETPLHAYILKDHGERCVLLLRPSSSMEACVQRAVSRRGEAGRGVCGVFFGIRRRCVNRAVRRWLSRGERGTRVHRVFRFLLLCFRCWYVVNIGVEKNGR